jgi:Ulp1 protease family, C-terminal catalytic domain
MPHSPEEGYNSVRKWTSKFDIFQKKYVIVPINEKYVNSIDGYDMFFSRQGSLHWYLAIIYLPEYTLLPRPVQETTVHPRRSTRRLGVIVDSPDAKQPEPAPGQSPPPDPGPPPNNRSSELIIPESPRTDDQRDEIDVERMVESGDTPVELPDKQADGQVLEASTDVQMDMVVDLETSPTLLYPQSSPLARQATLSPSDPQVEEMTEQFSTSMSEENAIRASGIPPTTFYGTKNHERRNATPQPVSVDNATPAEIEIDEDETMGNADSEPEDATQ